MTDDELLLRDIAYPLIEPPYDRQRWFSVLNEYGLARSFNPAWYFCDPTAYAARLMNEWVRSETTRYSRLNVDIRNDVARLEWAIDESHRAADFVCAPDIVLGALALTAPKRLPALSMRLAPSCRLITSEFPILRIWQVNQSGYEGDIRVSLTEASDRLLVRRDADGISLRQISSGDFAWLAALASGASLVMAIEDAQRVAATFDLGTALHAYIGDNTIAAVVEPG